MIRHDKYHCSLYALHGVMIKARDLAYQSQDNEKLAKLLDYAEHLPRLIASEEDCTNIFANTIEQIAKEFQADFVLDRYNQKAPKTW